MKIFLAIPLNAPAAHLISEMKKRGLVAIVCRSRNLAEHKRLILEADVVGHFVSCLDPMVRLQLEFARANEREVVTIEWVKKNLKK